MAENEQKNLDALLERSSGTDIPFLLKAKEEAKEKAEDIRKAVDDK